MKLFTLLILSLVPLSISAESPDYSNYFDYLDYLQRDMGICQYHLKPYDQIGCESDLSTPEQHRWYWTGYLCALRNAHSNALTFPLFGKPTTTLD